MSQVKNEYNKIMQEVNEAVITERQRQDELYGIQVRPVGEWLSIVMEEVGEAAQAAQPIMGIGTTKPGDATNYYMECVHAAAVFSRMAEQALYEQRHGIEKTIMDAHKILQEETTGVNLSPLEPFEDTCQHDWKMHDDGPWIIYKCHKCGGES